MCGEDAPAVLIWVTIGRRSSALLYARSIPAMSRLNRNPSKEPPCPTKKGDLAREVVATSSGIPS